MRSAFRRPYSIELPVLRTLRWKRAAGELREFKSLQCTSELPYGQQNLGHQSLLDPLTAWKRAAGE